MSRSRRLLSGSIAAVSVAALVAGAVLAPGAGATSSRKTYSYTEHCKGKLSGTSSSSGTCKSKLGNSKYKVVITPPTEKQVETYKNGKIYSSGTVTIANGKAGGKYKITRGTGHFRGATGKGTYSVVNKGGYVYTTATGTISF